MINDPVRIQLCNFYQRLKFKQKCITGDHMLTTSYIFIELGYSTLISDLYGLMRCILYLIFITPYCNVTVPLVNTLHYKKWALIWRRLFVCRAIIKHDLYLQLLRYHLRLWQSWSDILPFLWIIF